MKTKLLLCSAMVLSTYSTAAHAQTSDEIVQTNRLDEIIVSAQRRSQSILDVPVAVQAFDAAALEAQGIDDIKDLNTAAPSVFINSLQERSGNTPVRIRGIGTVGSNPGFEGAVGVYIDDVFRSRAGMALTSFTDPAGLEVLRGPQGTLFGKNTTAGALVLKSNAPDLEEFSAEVGVTVGNFDTQRYEGYFNVPVSDTLAFRASALVDRSDGFFTQPVTGENNNPVETETYRLQAAFEPTDSFRARVIADYTEASGPFGYGRSPNIADENAFDREIAITSQNSNDVADQGIALHLEYDIADNLSIRSITSKRGFTDDNIGGDWDFGAIDIAGVLDITYDFDTFSQEFLLTGKQDFGASSLDYTLGVNYFDEDFDYTRRTTVGSLFGPVFTGVLSAGGTGFQFFELGDCPAVNNALGCFSTAQVGREDAPITDSDFISEEESLGIFGHGTFNVNDQWSLVGGLRYNNVDKTITHTGNIPDYFNFILANNLFVGGTGVFSTGIDFVEDVENEELTYNGAIQYRPNSDMQLYASYSRGFKAGGVNIDVTAAGGGPCLACAAVNPLGPFTPLTPDAIAFEPEFVDSYELGFKWEYGGAGRLSVTAFRSEFDDLQVSIFTGQVFVVRNAGTATTQGIEIENTYAVSDDLTLNGALTWLETSDFGDGVDPSLAAGRRRGQAPKLALNIGGTYDRPVTEDIDAYLNANLAYNSSIFLSDNAALADVEQDGYAVLGGSIGLRDLGNWDISAFCRNCLDEEYFTFAFAQPFVAGNTLGNTGDPRTYGVKLTKGF